MKRLGLRFTVGASVLLVFGAVATFLIIDGGKLPREPLPPKTAPGAPKQKPASTREEAESPGPAASAHQAKLPTIDAAPSVRKAPPPVPPVPLQVLTSRYGDEIKQKWAWREILDKHIQAEPELSATLETKLRGLSEPMLFITLSQALDDPLLRLAVLERWEESIRLSHPLVAMVEEAAVKFGVRRQGVPPVKDVREMAALVKAIEPHFQSDYQRVLEKQQINEDLAKVYESFKAREVLENYLIRYMTDRGYPYSPDQRGFLPRSQNR